ncbi:MAG: Uncharacterised protein [Flavobacteriia bacterium]|nr:MAG: Uncharacterised protein [Flavobacteriia bacterium]
MLKEWNERCGDGCDLIGRHIHVLYAGGFHQREVPFVTGLHPFVHEVPVIVDRRIGLCDHFGFFFLCAEIAGRLVHLNDSVLDHAIRRLDEAHLIHFRKDAHGGDQTDVRTFRCFDRTKPSVVGVVHIAHLKASSFSGKAARAEGRHSPLVCDLRQWIGLIHELTELIRTKERIDHRRKRLRIDQVDGCKDLVVPHVHAFSDRSRHSRKTHSELIGQLLANGAHPSVAQVIDVVHLRFGVDQFDQVLDDADDVLLGQYLDVRFDLEFELFVQTVTTDFSKVVSRLREKQLIDDSPGRLLIGRLSISKLSVNVFYRFFFRVGRIFLKRVVNDGVVRVFCVLTVQQNGRYIRIQDFLYVVLLEHCIPIQDHLISLNGYNLSGILIHKILQPALQDTSCQFPAHHLFESGLGNFDLLGQIEYLKDVLVPFVSDGAQQGGQREFLLSIDVGVHHIVDVRRKFDP